MVEERNNPYNPFLNSDKGVIMKLQYPMLLGKHVNQWTVYQERVHTKV